MQGKLIMLAQIVCLDMMQEKWAYRPHLRILATNMHQTEQCKYPSCYTRQIPISRGVIATHRQQAIVVHSPCASCLQSSEGGGPENH